MIKYSKFTHNIGSGNFTDTFCQNTNKFKKSRGMSYPHTPLLGMPLIPYLAKFWFLNYELKCCQTIKLQDSIKSNISRKKWMMKFIFGMQINIEGFYKFMLSFWVCVNRHAQSTQNKKFAYITSLHISRKAWGRSWFFCLQ